MIIFDILMLITGQFTYLWKFDAADQQWHIQIRELDLRDSESETIM